MVEAKVTGANTGGLECQVNNLRAFIPVSQISTYRTENPADYIGEKLICVVTEANERRGNLVLSRRAVLEREKEESKKQLMAELAPGQMREGTIRKDLRRKLASHAFFGILDEMVTTWVLSPQDYDLPQLAEAAGDLFLNGAAATAKVAKLPRSAKLAKVGS